ncbi:FAD-dependent oxidoreductase [Aquabacter sp. L1I39]|uniref:NAD(P)/FAD-dependent oxidoreductase n=1 Tax=Aquabacter sp. L1I39 TaxID=2820278 RepID=UPI001ADACE28|nr:FAD-dependent oxidoreductase [Aquabacter sp. L1I39]QTL01552.1 FAD-dependent oxidoreductase [Aquabacter sp. L1I39]
MGARHHDADVIVVGGGPAGAAAAIVAASRGLATLLCEHKPERSLPGESLQPGIEPLMIQLGLPDGLAQVSGARNAGVWISLAGKTSFQAFGGDASGSWQGWQIRRPAFETLLRNRAAALGAQLLMPCRVRAPLLESGCVIGVATEAGPFFAPLVIDASGSARWLSRSLGLPVARHSPILRVRYGYRTGACPARDKAPALIANQDGWTWSARIRGGVYQWTRLRVDREALQTDAPPDELSGLDPLGPSRGADVTWRLAQRSAGPGWMITGDAAARLDPASAQGVLRAVMGGMMAGHAAHRHLREGVELAEPYTRWQTERFFARANALTGFYRSIGFPGFG